MLEEENLMLSSNQESTTKDQRKSIECYSEKAWRNLQNCGIDPWTSNFEEWYLPYTEAELHLSLLNFLPEHQKSVI